MRIRGVGRIKGFATKIRNRLSPGGLILLYHRIADLPTDPQLLCVSPEHFGEHLQVIKTLAVPKRLRKLVKDANNRSIVPYSVGLTFDDGAADNLYNAKPLLERSGCPATVFVTTGHIDGIQEFWWDTLERIFLEPGQLPDKLEVALNGNTFEASLGAAAQYSDAEFERARAWTVLNESTPTRRQEIYQKLFDMLRPLPSAYRHRAIQTLQNWAGTEMVQRPTHRTLDEKEIRQLAADGLVEIGAHTVTHPVLASISVELQRDEIQASKLILEEILEQTVESFAYPFGQPADYSNATVKLVRKAGFTIACSNFRGIVHPRVDPLQLPRFVVQNWNGDEFERRLREWFRG